MAFSTLLWLVVQYLYRSGCEPHDTGQNRTVPVPAPVTWVTNRYSTSTAAACRRWRVWHALHVLQPIYFGNPAVYQDTDIVLLSSIKRLVYIYPIPHIHIPASRELFFINMVATFQKDREVYKKLIMSDPYVKKILTEYKRMEANAKLDKNVL